MGMVFSPVGIELDSFVDKFQRVADASDFRGDHAEQEMSVGVTRFVLQNAQAALLSRAELTLAKQLYGLLLQWPIIRLGR
jgi:hypothetical protein